MAWWFYALVGLGAFLVLADLAAGYAAYRMSFVRFDPKPLDESDPGVAFREAERRKGKEWLFSHDPEDVRLMSRDGLLLKGYYLPAARPSNSLVVFSHGYGCTGPNEFGVFLEYYHEKGFHILLPDHRSHGRSEGKYIGFAALEWQDILDWADAYVERLGPDTQVVLHGMSMGAATVMNCNAHNPPDYVKCVVEDCGYANGYEMMTLSAKRDMHIKFPPLFWACALWFRLFTGKSIRKDADPYGNAARFGKPMLFVHGAGDTYVPCEMSVRCYAAAKVEKDLLLVDGADHVMSYYNEPALYQAKLDEWFAKWIKEAVKAQ